MTSVSLVITSCARFDLLSKTLASFYNWNNYPLSQVIVCEDSPYADKTRRLLDLYDWQCPVCLLDNKHRIGQLASIDKAYQANTSDYVFHCEDDWIFSRSNFIQESIDILEQNLNVFSVWLRKRNELGHHLFSNERYVNSSGKDIGVRVVREICSFNPSLRRAADFRKYLPLEQYSHAMELGISAKLIDLGMYSVLLNHSATSHIGWHRKLDSQSQNKPQWYYDCKDAFKWLKSLIYKKLKIGHYRSPR